MTLHVGVKRVLVIWAAYNFSNLSNTTDKLRISILHSSTYKNKESSASPRFFHNVASVVFNNVNEVNECLTIPQWITQLWNKHNDSNPNHRQHFHTKRLVCYQRYLILATFNATSCLFCEESDPRMLSDKLGEKHPSKMLDEVQEMLINVLCAE